MLALILSIEQAADSSGGGSESSSIHIKQIHGVFTGILLKNM